MVKSTFGYNCAAIREYYFLKDVEYRQFILDNFDWVIPENCLKMCSWWKDEEIFDFSTWHSIEGYLWEKRVKGHAIFWHSHTPKFLKNISKERALYLIEKALEKLLIETACHVDCWDLFLEVFNDIGTLRQTYWGNLGIEKLYSIAASYPFLWFLNDNRTRCKLKWEAISKFLVNHPKLNLAIQLQTDCYLKSFNINNINNIINNKNNIINNNIKIHLPEVVVFQQRFVKLPLARQQQLKVYKQIADVGLKHNCELIGLWSPTNRYPWLFGYDKNDKPGLWDENLCFY